MVFQNRNDLRTVLPGYSSLPFQFPSTGIVGTLIECGLISYTTPLIDRIGDNTRESKIPKYFNGDGVWYGEFDEQLDNLDWQVELSVNFVSATSANRAFISQYLNGDSGRFWIGTDTTGNLVMQYGSSLVTTSISNGRYAVKATRVGSVLSLFLDGALVDTINITSDIADTKFKLYTPVQNISPSTADIYYVKINGTLYTPNEISDSSTQFNIISAEGVLGMTANLATSAWVQDSIQSDNSLNLYGWTEADGTTMYKDQALTTLYASGQIIESLQSGTNRSRLFCKAWTTGGVNVQLDNVGEIKRNIQETDASGVITPSGTHIKVSDTDGNVYPEIAKTDTTNYFTSDYTADVPTANVIAKTSLVNITNNQYFIGLESNEITQSTFYDESLTGNCLVSANSFMGFNEVYTVQTEEGSGIFEPYQVSDGTYYVLKEGVSTQ